jgi:hypothetical protein
LLSAEVELLKFGATIDPFSGLQNQAVEHFFFFIVRANLIHFKYLDKQPFLSLSDLQVIIL